MFPVTEVSSQSFLIFSSGTPELLERAMGIRKIPYKSLKGKYKGKEENCFIAPLKPMRDLATLLSDQDSALVLSPVQANGFRDAFLHVQEGRQVLPLGIFKPVPKEYAIAQESWTYDPEQDEYFVAEASLKAI